MGEYSYAHTTTPAFIVQSLYDTWAITNILGPGEEDGYSRCAQVAGPTLCTEEQIRELNGYAMDVEQRFLDIPKFSSAGNGGVFSSCLEHCGALDDFYWGTVNVQGTTFSAAVGEWFFERSAEPARVFDCLFEGPYACNPTCGDGSMAPAPSSPPTSPPLDPPSQPTRKPDPDGEPAVQEDGGNDSDSSIGAEVIAGAVLGCAFVLAVAAIAYAHRNRKKQAAGARCLTHYSDAPV